MHSVFAVAATECALVKSALLLDGPGRFHALAHLG
jgi:hypothetical protein